MGCAWVESSNGEQWDDDDNSAMRLARMVQRKNPSRYPELIRVARQLADDSTGRNRFSKT